MGRPNPRLTIAVDYRLIDHAKVQELREMGHEIVPQDLRSFDLLLGECAHYWDDNMWDFMPAALVAARARKRRKK